MIGGPGPIPTTRTSHHAFRQHNEAGAAFAGDCFDAASVGGMTQLNGNTYQAATLTDNTHLALNVNSTGFSTYTSGGTLTLVDFIHVNPTADALIAADLASATAGGW